MNSLKWNESFQKILNNITEQALKRPAPFVVAIEGRCCSGKTGLAFALGQKLQAPVLHIDDFYLSFRYRTPQRLEHVGGHVDFERFLEEVLLPVRRKEEVLYRPYCPHEDCWKAPQKIAPNRIYIAEGSYSLLPKLSPNYDYRIFLTVNPWVQQTRLLQREGAEKTKVFLSHWIAEEERYFNHCRTEQQVNFFLDTSELW